MLLVESNPVVGQVYGFEYVSCGGWCGKTNKKRLVLVQRVDKDGFFGHDFLADGPRNFKFAKISKVKDFTDKVMVFTYDEAYDKTEDGDVETMIEFYADKGYKVYDDEENETVYVANV